jgi:hypothetical protein
MREVEQLRRINARLLTEVRELKLSSHFPGRLTCVATTQTTAKLQWGSVSWAQAYALQYAVGEDGQVCLSVSAMHVTSHERVCFIRIS